MEKCPQLPVPMAKPNPMKATRTRIFVAVKTFCTRATRRTPKKFRMVNSAIKTDAVSCAPPSLSEKPAGPIVNCALACFSAGKK